MHISCRTCFLVLITYAMNACFLFCLVVFITTCTLSFSALSCCFRLYLVPIITSYRFILFFAEKNFRSFHATSGGVVCDSGNQELYKNYWWRDKYKYWASSGKEGGAFDSPPWYNFNSPFRIQVNILANRALPPPPHFIWVTPLSLKLHFCFLEIFLDESLMYNFGRVILHWNVHVCVRKGY